MECDRLSKEKTIEKLQQRLTSMEDATKLKHQEHNNKINNLETFASRICKLQQSLSDREVHLHLPDFERLEQKDYDKDKNVRKWRKQVEENENETNQCDYLQKLKTVIKNYEGFIHPATYSSRINYTIRHFMKENQCYSHSTKEIFFLKLKWSMYSNNICIRLFDNVNDYHHQKSKHGWISHSSFVKSFHEKHDLCIHYCLLSPFFKKGPVWLIGIDEENKTMKLRNGEKTVINDLPSYTDCCFIYLKIGQ